MTAQQYSQLMLRDPQMDWSDIIQLLELTIPNSIQPAQSTIETLVDDGLSIDQLLASF